MKTSKDNAYYVQSRQEVAPFLPSKYERVLEIGCAGGSFRIHLKNSCEYWGLDADKKALSISESTMHKSFNGIYEDFENELPDNYFDLVICNDVVEHMLDHEKFFKSIYTKIKKGGCLVGSIPNVRYIRNLHEVLIKRDWEYKKHGTLDETHFRFFTHKSLQRSLKDNGFEIIKFAGLNPVKSRRFKFYLRLINLWSFGKDKDMAFLQFGFQVRK
jgi:2-polyprenyl-3-methyl-5-hydroxy-6-metoxy-1,4-benzoquinol methylase